MYNEREPNLVGEAPERPRHSDEAIGYSPD